MSEPRSPDTPQEPGQASGPPTGAQPDAPSAEYQRQEYPPAPGYTPPPGHPAGYAPPGGYAPPPGYPPSPGYAPPPGYQPPPYPGHGQWGGQSTSDETTWAVLAHLSLFVLGFIGPLVILLTSGERSPFVRGHAAEALNFHITVLIACVVSFVLIFVVIGIFLLPAILIAAAVFAVIAAVAAGRHQPYRYPVNIRFVR